MHPTQVSQPQALKSSRVISTVVATAVRLWLLTQLDGVQDLKVQIEVSRSALISGLVPLIAVTARQAIYQGLYLRQISLVAKDIQINLNQILTGQPLRLNQPIPVSGELLLGEADLNNSLKSPMLANALTEFLLTLLKKAEDQKNGNMNPANLIKGQQITWKQIKFDTSHLVINGVCFDFDGKQTPVEIRAGLQVEKGHLLQCSRIAIELLLLPKIELDRFLVDLGSEVNIEELTLNPGQLTCRGRILVRP